MLLRSVTGCREVLQSTDQVMLFVTQNTPRQSTKGIPRNQPGKEEFFLFASTLALILRRTSWYDWYKEV